VHVTVQFSVLVLAEVEITVNVPWSPPPPETLLSYPPAYSTVHVSVSAVCVAETFVMVPSALLPDVDVSKIDVVVSTLTDS